MIRALKFIIPIILIIVVAFIGLRILNANKPVPEVSTEAPKPLSVFGEQIELRTLTFTVKVQGEVRPRSEISVTSQVQGRIDYISDSFVDGGYIARGQTIARLDKADYELAVVRARSGVASAEQALAREQAESELAIKDLEELGIAQSSPLARREPQMAEAQAALDSAIAQLSEANLALERTIIKAPFNVRVRERSADVGQFITPGQTLGSIFATDSVEVALPITDTQMGQLGLPLAFTHSRQTPGPEVIFSTKVGGQMRHWTGRITRTAAAVNSNSRLINIFGELQDPYGAGSDDGIPMAPGLFVNATITGKVIEDVLWAPRAALRGNDELYVGDQDSGTLSIRKIDVLFSDTEGVYFNVGAEIGELAIVSPVQAAFDGMQLGIRERLADGTIVEEKVSEASKTEALASVSAEQETAQ